MTPERWIRVRSLVEQAMVRPVAERSVFLDKATSDPQLRAEVDQLLAHEREASSVFSIGGWNLQAQSAIAETSLAGVVIGSYRLIRELGRGGMGAVYLAERADGEYQQKVALKILQESVFTPSLVERFRQERQILAGLSHPGIARLLDGGLTPDGRPYLVLEYVDGLPIDLYCDHHGLDTQARLSLFIRVAEVVQSAHQQLVLHLDLKPANILVTEEGEPRLLDFGIARFLTDAEPGLGSQRTEATLRLLTPRYASPEQARGSPLGVASDVFSLATLLYRLLTGKLPYPIEDASPLEAAGIILGVEPAPPSVSAPSAIQPQLKGDLDTILLQALRKEPERRYPTVAAFAEDIQRHLSSEPVQAHADSFSYRAGKFLRRNRAPVIASAAVVLILAASVVAVARSAVVAKRQRALAERRFGDIRALAHSYIFELDPQLEEVPGTVKVRGFIIKNALKYLEAMSKEDIQDDALAKEIAQGYMRVSQVQADPAMPSLNDRVGAWDSLNRSYAINKRLLDKNPDDMKQRGLMLSQMRFMSFLAIADGDISGAENYIQRGIEFGKPTLEAGANAPRYLTLMAFDWDMASLRAGNGDLWNSADPVGALPWVDKLRILIQNYIAAHPSNPVNKDAADYLQREYLTRAEIYRQIGRESEAGPLIQESLRVVEQEGTKNIIGKEAAKVLRAELASYYVQVQNVAAANAIAGTLLPESYHEKGGDRQLNSDEADTLSVLARIDLLSGRIAEGKRKVDQSMKIFEKLYAEDPKDANNSSELAHASVDIADQKLLDTPTRRLLYTRGIEVAEAYTKLHPEGLSGTLLAGRAKLRLAELDHTAHATTDQQAHARAAIADLQKVLNAHPIQPQATQFLNEASALLTP